MSQIDWDLLLKPISESLPCGTDLELDDAGPHWKILETRREAKSEEDQQSPQAESVWRRLDKLCLETLANHSKDMRYVAFLIEARLRTSGIDGISDGMEVLERFVLAFREKLLPLGENLEECLLPVNQLDSKLLEQPMRMLQITQGSQGGLRFWQYAHAQLLEQKSAEERAAAASRNEASLDAIKQAANETPTDFFVGLRSSIARCRTRIDLANTAVQEVAGKRLTSFSKIRAVLDTIESAIGFLAGSRMPADTANAVTDSEPATGAQSTGVQQDKPRPDGVLSHRKDAFFQLNLIAEFFERTEPQSVLPAQIRRIIRWGNMSPQELYGELIDNEDVRSSMYRLIGLEMPVVK